MPRGVGSALPVFVRRASGVTVEDVDGNQLLDFTGGIGQNAGHVLPEALNAIKEQAADFIHTCFMVTPYEGYVRLAEGLNERTAGAFPKKTFFVSTGAEAVESAIKIARHYTRRQVVIAFEGTFDLSQRSRQVGELFEASTRDWPQRFPTIGEIRGIGAM